MAAAINNNGSLLAKRCMKANAGGLSDNVYRKQTKIFSKYANEIASISMSYKQVS